MGGPDSVPLPANVAPGQTIDVSVNLSAPKDPGEYRGFWQLQDSNGRNFGVGTAANEHIWVKIKAITPALDTQSVTPVVSSATPLSTPTLTIQPLRPLEIAADLVGNACAAQWQSNDGVLPCPGLDGDTHGFVVTKTQADLEDGTIASLPTLLTFPQFSADGYIQGTYPEYQVQAGDHLQTTVSCELGSTSCSVLFRISYMDASGTSHDLWTLGEFYDGDYFNLDLDLGQLAGEKVRFILSVSSLGSPVGDRALWVGPRIVHFAVPTPTAVSTSTPTLPAPSLTPTSTPVPVPTSTLTPTSTPAAGGQGPLPSIPQIIESIISFLRQLFGR